MGFFDKLLGKKQNENTQVSTTTAAPTPSSKKILVVEDDQYLRDFYAELISSEGYQVITATNGYDGYNQVIAQSPSLVLTDLMMPVMDGKMMLHKIRETKEFATLPVIVLTNAGTADNIRETKFFNNANDFLIKSNVQPDEILAKIKALAPK